MWSRAIQAWHAGHCRHNALRLVLLTQSKDVRNLAFGTEYGTISHQGNGQCRLTFDTKDAQASLRFGEVFEDGVTKIVVADVAPNSPAEEVGSIIGRKLGLATGITADMHARVIVARTRHITASLQWLAVQRARPCMLSWLRFAPSATCGLHSRHASACRQASNCMTVSGAGCSRVWSTSPALAGRREHSASCPP